MRCMRVHGMHRISLHAFVALSISRTANDGCPPARPRFASRVCCCLRAASVGSAARRASFASDWGRLSFAGSRTTVTLNARRAACRFRAISRLVPSGRTLRLLRRFAFLRSVFWKLLHAFDLVQRGRPFFLRVCYIWQTSTDLLTAGL